ncbi:PAS domain S-box protein [Salinirubellus salinus]|uniref:histidine kinase n=1 Tax=Salinirubellus salinus TaxID=1364945 RepID=A0A9E7UAF9_9EURY|nr:PAS domain S-box protein [Salinirubellus salinus]UWM54213.1 PAS domain S-box protein [Salinirubellus salinus]
MAGAPLPIRLLHVDDEPGFAALAGANLDRLGGFDVHTETAPTAALAYLAAHDVDCVVSDYQMPEMDGLEFLQEVRARSPDLPFVLFTGKGSEEIASDAIAAGVTDYLQKATVPDHFAVLAHRVRRAVEHHEAERRLTESEQRYRSVVEESGLSVVIYGPAGLRYANEAACELTGYDRETLLSMELRSLVHPEDRALVDERVTARLLGEDPPPRYEVRLLDADGEVLEVEMTGRRLDGPDGPTVLGIARDRTQARRQERELVRRERQYRTLAEHVPDGGVALVDRDLTYALAAGRVFELVDLDVDDVAGRPFEEVHSPEYLAAVAEEYEAAFDGEERSFEFSYDGREFEASLVPIRGPAGIDQVMVLTLDVTERNRRANELERQNERLDRFASTLSHDLRNPLAVARGTVDVLETDLGGPRAETRRIREALSRADDLVDSVLALSREGDATLDPTWLVLEEVAREAWTTVETGTARLRVAPETPTVVADPRSLRTLLENCFRNSVEHGSEGVDTSVTVEVGALSGADGFYVVDDGAGVLASDRERIFEYGVSGDGGLGLGLAIVTEVVHNHGWTVAAETGADGGLRLVFDGVEVRDTSTA